MADPQPKSREALTAELEALRRRVAELEPLAERCRRAETALQESEERFALFMRYLPGAAFILDGQGTFLFANEAHISLLGLTPAAIQGRNINELFPPEVTERFRAQNRRVLAAGDSLVVEERIPDQEQNRYWLTCKFPIPRQGLAPLIGGIALDISKARQDKEALRKSEELFRLFFAAAVSGMAILEPSGRPVEVNPALCHFLGRSREELLQGGFLRVTHPDEVAESRRLYGELLAGKRQVVDHERRFIHKDGTTVWGHVRGTWLRDGQQQPSHWVTLVEDITERKRVEEELRRAVVAAEEAREQVDAILRSVVDGLIVTDMRHRIVLMNQAAEAQLGLRATEVIGLTVRQVIRNKGLPGALLAITPQAAARPGGVDLELPGPDAPSPRVLRARTSLLRSGQERPTGAVTLLQDVTRERELDRLKNEFISTAAHELHTPLTALLGFAEVLLHPETFGPFSAEQQREFLAEIYQSGERLAGTVDDLLDLSRIESGRGIPLRRSPCDLAALVGKVVAYFRRLAQGHGFVLELVATRPPVLVVDRDKVVQVLENLLSNAVRYSPGGSTIRIGGEETAEGYRIEVSDEGIGMTPLQASRAFEKFYRVDASNTARGGLGLGLSIARHIVEAHGGRIWVTSNPGAGTTVSFLLPAESGEAG